MTTSKYHLIFVDVEAATASPASGWMAEFGAVHYPSKETFYGKDAEQKTMIEFDEWLEQFPGRKVFVSDNPAYDWQWINYTFDFWGMRNPFGHSARRIGDYYAGLAGNFFKSSEWKVLRVTPHDHNPVNDAMGNVEAFERMQEGERA